MHRLSVRGHHRHLQPGDAHVEEGHRRAVDEAQAHALAALEQRGPVAVRRGAVGQVGVGERADVGQVRGAHAHASPGLAVGQRGLEAVALRIAQEIADGALVQVVVVGLDAQLAQDRMRILVAPVRQQDHMVTIGGDRIRFARFDHDRAVHAQRFLQAGMRVVPVGAGLAHLEGVQPAFARADAVEAQPRHAVHVGRQQDAVPVQRGVLAQTVAHAQAHRVAFAPAQHRRGQRTVDGLRPGVAAGEVHRPAPDLQREIGAAQFGHVRRTRRRRRLRERGAGQGACRRKPERAGDEGAAVHVDVQWHGALILRLSNHQFTGQAATKPAGSATRKPAQNCGCSTDGAAMPPMW